MTESAVLRLVLSLFLIIVLILAGAWLTRRAGWLRGGANHAIKLIGSQSLGSRAYVALVEVENIRLVLGVTATQISLLHTLPESEQDRAASTPAAASEPTPLFASSLKKIMALRR